MIRAVARGHQKYFVSSVEGDGEALLPHYLAVVNTANRPDLITRGTDRAMRARLADARFFWEEDQKAPLEERLEKLGGDRISQSTRHGPGEGRLASSAWRATLRSISGWRSR